MPLCACWIICSHFGLGASAEEIDMNSFIAAQMSAMKPLPRWMPPRKRYTCNGVVDLNDSARDVLESMLGSCAGYLTYTGGKWRLQVGAIMNLLKPLMRVSVMLLLCVRIAHAASYSIRSKARLSRRIITGRPRIIRRWLRIYISRRIAVKRLSLRWIYLSPRPIPWRSALPKSRWSKSADNARSISRQSGGVSGDGREHGCR